MNTWKLFLILGFAVFGVVRCHDLDRHSEKPDIVCLVNVYPEISEGILEKLEACNHIIICYDGLCDLARKLRHFSDAKRVALIRSRAPNAKILRQVEVHFGEHYDPDQAVQSVQASLAEGIFDGVELAFDSAQLDQPGQIKYAQFLKLLKRTLDDHLLISNSFVCKQHLPAFLLNAMVDVLDYVILVPSSQHPSAEQSVLAPRIYSDSVANCLLNANFPRSKIVLGLPTGGQLVDPSANRESPSSLIPYGNVCELHEEQLRYCAERGNRDCSLFGDGVKLIYDDPNSAGGRALQCVGCRLRGISIALSYDDSAGVCVGSSFPLLAAIQNVFEHRSGVVGFQGCPSDPFDSSESGEYGHGSDSSCEDQSHSSSEEDDCCNDSGKSCNGCKLLNRLQGAVKTSEHVVGMSKGIADKVLESLDHVVSLISYMLGQQPAQPNSDGGDPQAALLPLGVNLAPISPAVDSVVQNLLNSSNPLTVSLGLGALNPGLPLASQSAAAPTGIVPVVLNTVNQTVGSLASVVQTSPNVDVPLLSFDPIVAPNRAAAVLSAPAPTGIIPLVLNTVNQTVGTFPVVNDTVPSIQALAETVQSPLNAVYAKQFKNFSVVVINGTRIG